MNFKKADWPTFSEYTETQFSKLQIPTDIYKAEKCFRRIINQASKKCIPHGRIKEIIPEIPAEAVTKMKERDEIRKISPTSLQIGELNIEIDTAIKDYKRSKWREKVESIGRKTDSGKLFKLIKGLNGQPAPKDNQGIRFKGKIISVASKIADGFNKQFSSVKRHTSSKETRKITKASKKNSLSGVVKFTDSQTKDAIKKAKASKAIGPDGISNLHLKHLGPAGISYLTEIFNLSTAKSQIPQIWKKSIIIPLLKPTKEADESTSYRPVSLLCPAVKILERLVLPTLQEHLEVPDFQHGFRAKHSTVSALDDLNQDISAGFNMKKPAARTVLLQIDMSKAFDMVSHKKLLADLNKSTLPPFIKRWLNCYLHGRQSTVNFRNKTSKSRNVRTGVPQGAVISPILFNFYLSKMPVPPSGIKIIQYADDVSIYASGTDIKLLCSQISYFINHLVNYFEERELEISPEKSTITLFTPDTHEANIHPIVKIKNKIVKLDQNPKILGIYFDKMHFFNHHATKTAAKANKKINILKALAGTTWGQDQETLLITYKSIGRSVLEYGSPIWSPAISDTSWDKLQRVQNKALKVATGTYHNASFQHIHRETKVLPLKEHGRMISEQYLAACHLPGHPGQKHLGRPPSARPLKKTHLNYKNSVSPLFPAQPDENSYKYVKKVIHTRSVESTINSYEPSKVLGRTPPPIHKEELTLSRKTRATLSQLRSGYSKMLNNYNHRLDNNIPDECPDCSLTPHNVEHLFNCQNKPTNLTIESLWHEPRRTSIFLNLELEQDSEEDG